MNSQDIIQLFVSFAGGGVAGSLITLWSNLRTQRKARRIDHIRSQLENLYGPLRFLTSWNANLLQTADNLHKAYEKEFVEIKYSPEESTQTIVGSEASQTIELANQYVRQTKQINEKIISLLESHYSFIDPNDVDIFSRFVVDYVRMKTEVDQQGTTVTPFQIYQRLGSISFIHPDFIKAVDYRFRKLKNELSALVD